MPGKCFRSVCNVRILLSLNVGPHPSFVSVFRVRPLHIRERWNIHGKNFFGVFFEGQFFETSQHTLPLPVPDSGTTITILCHPSWSHVGVLKTTQLNNKRLSRGEYSMPVRRITHPGVKNWCHSVAIKTNHHKTGINRYETQIILSKPMKKSWAPHLFGISGSITRSNPGFGSSMNRCARQTWARKLLGTVSCLDNRPRQCYTGIPTHPSPLPVLNAVLTRFFHDSLITSMNIPPGRFLPASRGRTIRHPRVRW